MDSFEAAFDHIIGVEKYYSNKPLDHGGPTKYGISSRTLSAYIGRTVAESEMKSITISFAKEIYKKLFWDFLKLDRFPEDLALAVFDQAVNRSPKDAVISLQHALGAKPDGVLGPVTMSMAISANQKELIWGFLKDSMIAYCRIVRNDPSQSEFIAGWTNRIFQLIEKLLIGESLQQFLPNLSPYREAPAPKA